MDRRCFLVAAAAAVGLGARFAPAGYAAPAGAGAWAQLTDAQWKARLTPAQYRVLRAADTERAGSSPLTHEKRAGLFVCAGCGLPLFSSRAKFDSGTGWPSFWAALPGATATRNERSFFTTRIEEHCRRCGGHLGHIFDDGPPPTGKRHCINGVALAFRPAGAQP